MDPVGNVSSVITLLKDLEPKRRIFVLIREMLIALVAMLVFYFIGDPILDAVQLDATTVRLSSGVILFLIAIKILFPASNGLRANLPKGEPFIIPLAIPLIAGPSLLATIMLYANQELGNALMLSAIGISWVCALIVLLCAPYLQRYLGNNGLMALEKLMGMVLVIMAIQRFSEGIQQVLSQHM